MPLDLTKIWKEPLTEAGSQVVNQANLSLVLALQVDFETI